jgi:homoserine dehydrogenase
MAAVVNLALIGPGLVGKEFLSQVSLLNFKVTFHLIALATSTRMSLNLNGLDPSKELEELEELADIQKFIKFLPKDTIIIDSTSSPKIASLYPEMLQTCHIITPNKKPFSSSMQLYEKIKSSKPFCLHESSVGAGLPILSTLSDLVLSGDKVIKIEGILSGTLSYIFNTFTSSNENFSSIVIKAQQQGFTEPDPRDDLNGMGNLYLIIDVARKVVILGREVGMKIEIEDVLVENIVPEELRELDTKEFMNQLHTANEYFETKKTQAASRGKVLRYVGVVEGGECRVELKEYESSHAFANLKGSDNVIAMTTRRFPNPLVTVF